MDDTELFNQLWEDDTPRENCVFFTRKIPKASDMYNPRWPGACCDATSMLLTKEYNKPLTNVVIITKDKNVLEYKNLIPTVV